MSRASAGGAPREEEYQRAGTTKFSGVSGDAGDDARPFGSLRDGHNVRYPGQSPFPVTRSGYRRFAYIETKEDSQTFGDAGPIHPIAKGEYVYWHPNADGSGQTAFRADVSVAWLEGALAIEVLLLDKSATEGTGTGWNHEKIIVKSACATKPTGCVEQYGMYLVVSLFNDATYIMWPAAIAENIPAVGPRSLTIGPHWNVEVLGKDVCPAPAHYDFPLDVTGDLICYSAHDKAGGGNYEMEYDTASTTDPTPLTLRLPIEAKYTRAGGGLFGTNASSASEAAIAATKLIPRWRFAKKDAGPNAGTPGTDGIAHYMHRGYFYRFVFVRTITLPDGTKVKMRSHPSTDIFVPAIVYAPFFWDEATTATPHAFPYKMTGSKGISGWNDNVPEVGTYTKGQWTPVPSLQAMVDLQSAYKKYFNDSSADDPNGTSIPLHWVAHWLRWNHVGDQTVFGKQPPYKCDPTAEEITGAPQTVFDWADFKFSDMGISNAVADEIDEIEVYRTAYEDVDPEFRAVKTPLFKPHVYGLVGSIVKGGTFTDKTKTPDFGDDPNEYNGYLKGQFSGDISFQYGQSPAFVLGNVRVDYSLLVPSPLVQCFADGPGGYGKGSFTIDAADNQKIVHFSYCYEDRDGYRSAAVDISPPDVSAKSDTDTFSVGFTFPYGYAPSIKHILLFKSQCNVLNSTRSLTLLATIDPEPGTYLSNNAETPVSATLPAGDAPKFYEPGAIIYSKPDQLWDFPQEYSEKHHGTEPVRRLQGQMGELEVATDGSYSLTLLRSDKPRSEQETTQVGAISKFAAAKVEDCDMVISAHGLYLLTPSRAEALRHPCENELAKYLSERIPVTLDANSEFYPALANARRASIGYLDQTRELFLHLPSSADFWPKLPDDTGALTVVNPKALPQRTFVFHFGPNLREVESYSFDLTTEFEIKMKTSSVPGAPPVVDRSTFNSWPVIFHAGSDGSLWASYTDLRPGYHGCLVSIDCHYPQKDYQGYSAIELSLGAAAIGDIGVQKQIEKVFVKLKARGEVQIITGPPKRAEGGMDDALDGWDPLRGHISDAAEVFDVLRVRKDTARVYQHSAIDRALETKGSALLLRIRTTPNADQEHRVEFRGVTVRYDEKEIG